MKNLLQWPDNGAGRLFRCVIEFENFFIRILFYRGISRVKGRDFLSRDKKMSWQEEKHEEIKINILSYFQEKISKDPDSTLQQVELELQDIYIREGNNQSGRGIVGDTVIQATIEALEIVRAACLDAVK